jgi:transposase-like protein
MVRPGREMLSGTVEIDETYIGGFAEGSPGRSSDSKQAVVMAVEVSDNKIGRIRMKPINSVSAADLLPFILDNVELGSTIITDGWSSYHKVNTLGYKHIVKIISSNKEELPHVNLVISLVKRWLLSSYQGSISNKYLDYYYMSIYLDLIAVNQDLEVNYFSV